MFTPTGARFAAIYHFGTPDGLNGRRHQQRTGRQMRRAAWLFASLLVILALGVFGAAAQHIRPSGKPIGRDRQGHAIYQVRANGIDVGYKLIGSGPPLVMIMGLDCTMEQWPPEVVGALSERYQLIMLDNRGMGYSTANETAFTYKLFADDVIGLLDALGVKKAHVLGYSMGSAITQELLLEYPQRFDKAVIFATTMDGSKVAGALKNKTSGQVNPIVLRQMEATVLWKTPLDKLPLIHNQVLLLVGTSDSVVGAEPSKTLASAIPGAWLVQIRNASHSLMQEMPVEFVRIVLTFLDIDVAATGKSAAAPK